MSYRYNPKVKASLEKSVISVAEFKGQIVDIFEDYLSERGITAENLPNEDRDEYEAYHREDAAIIFGEDYDIIADGVQHELDTNDLMVGGPALTSQDDVIKVVNNIYATYEEVAAKLVNTDFALSDEDANHLKEEIRQTFLKWGLVAA